MTIIDLAEFETVKNALAEANANVHLVLNRLGLEDIASPYSSYVEVCQQYQAAAQRIRETHTADELRAYLLETPKTAESPEENEPVEPR